MQDSVRIVVAQIYYASEEFGVHDICTSGGYFHMAEVFLQQGNVTVAQSLYHQVSFSLCLIGTSFWIVKDQQLIIFINFWRFVVVVNALVSISEVNLRRAQLVLGWVTVSVIQLPVWENLSQSVYNQSPRSTQPGHPSVGTRNEYQPKWCPAAGE